MMKVKSNSCLVVLAAVLASFLCQHLVAGPVPLFDGKTFHGWEGETTKVWRIEDGAVVGGSMEGNPQNEFLATRQSYRNFVLKLEYQLTGTEGFVNGGVQFRSKRIDKPRNEMSGFQADIGAGYSGCLYDESRRNKMLLVADKEVITKAERPGEWNAYEIRVEANRIQLFVNGVRTVDYTETDTTIEKEGLIALQIHGNNKAVVRYRKITIESLPDDAGSGKGEIPGRLANSLGGRSGHVTLENAHFPRVARSSTIFLRTSSRSVPARERASWALRRPYLTPKS